MKEKNVANKSGKNSRNSKVIIAVLLGVIILLTIWIILLKTGVVTSSNFQGKSSLEGSDEENKKKYQQLDKINFSDGNVKQSYYAKECGAGKFSFSIQIVDGKLVVTNLDSKDKYTIKSIDVVESIIEIPDVSDCKGVSYAVLTTDDRVYYTPHFFVDSDKVKMDDISDFENVFEEVLSPYSLERLVIFKNKENKAINFLGAIDSDGNQYIYYSALSLQDNYRDGEWYRLG